MNRNQYFDKHQNLNINREELERKYNVYIREQEYMGMVQSGVGVGGGGGGGGLPSNCIQFVVDTTETTEFNMAFISTGEPITFTIDWGDGTTEDDEGIGGYYEESHEYPELNQQYTVRMCFDDPAKILELEFYGND